MLPIFGDRKRWQFFNYNKKRTVIGTFTEKSLHFSDEKKIISYIRNAFRYLRSTGDYTSKHVEQHTHTVWATHSSHTLMRETYWPTLPLWSVECIKIPFHITTSCFPASHTDQPTGRRIGRPDDRKPMVLIALHFKMEYKSGAQKTFCSYFSLPLILSLPHTNCRRHNKRKSNTHTTVTYIQDDEKKEERIVNNLHSPVAGRHGKKAECWFLKTGSY